MKIVPIDSLPNNVKKHYHDMVSYLNSRKPELARESFRELIKYYTQNDLEVPIDIEIQYGLLYSLELNAEGKKIKKT